MPFQLEPSTGQVTHIGPQAESLLGFPREDWLAAAFWMERVVPDDQTGLVSTRSAVAREGIPRTVDYRMEHADGRVVWVCESISSTKLGEETVLSGYLMDITDRKRQEVALWKSEERLRALLRAAPDAMVLTDIEGNILDMNLLAASRNDDILAFDDITNQRIPFGLSDWSRQSIDSGRS